MGEVYRARDPRLAREVAIKVLRTETGLNEERRRRFEIEARAASSPTQANSNERQSNRGEDAIIS